MTRSYGKDRPFFQKATNKPEVIAHRGGAGQWPEETIFAFQNALDAGADVLEMDLRCTKDGKFVMLHDPTVDRTTDGAGKIDDLDFEQEVKSLNAAYMWPDYIDKGITIATLDDVLKEFREARLNIEIKPDDIEIVPQICDAIAQHNMEENVLIASEHNRVIHEVRRSVPGSRHPPRYLKLQNSKPSTRSLTGVIARIPTLCNGFRRLCISCRLLPRNLSTRPIILGSWYMHGQ
jgi:glycerophosphoryl diester phosphodiesterase